MTDLRKISIFALDDDQGDIVLLSRYLEDIPGWQVTFDSVSSWSEGRTALVSREIDVIFLDYLLGEETGLTVVRAIRESGDERPVIILTGQGDERVAAEITRAGADDYLVKSELSPDLLRRSISNALAQFQLKKERALLREGLHQAQKMETIGALASGIAHDFNNMLTAMVGHVEIARLKDTENLCEDNLLKIKTVCQQMSDLVQRLLSFSGKRANERTLIDFRHIIEEAKTVLFHTLPKNIQIEFSLEEIPLFLHANSAMLHQILLSLCSNGVEAMSKGGTLAVRVKKASVNEEVAALSPPLKSGEYALLEVEDTGAGIHDKIINKIFDPFFSTKERSVNKGTGLGLAVTWQNVKEHDGFIFVESEVGSGSIFKVYLPLAQKTLRIPVPSPEGETVESEYKPKSILLIDDEVIVREIGQEMLQSLGYSVLLADSGKLGLEMFLKNRNDIGLVILDIYLPDLDGRECIKELIRIDDTVKVIFASGYVAGFEEEDLLALGAKGVIQKPFAMKQLGQLLKSLLSQ